MVEVARVRGLDTPPKTVRSGYTESPSPKWWGALSNMSDETGNNRMWTTMEPKEFYRRLFLIVVVLVLLGVVLVLLRSF